MAFDNKDVKPRKKSYYPFAKNYPGRRSGTSYAIGESRARRKKEKTTRAIFAIVLCVLFVLTFLLSSIAIQLSNRPYEKHSSGIAAEYDGQLKALYMPDDILDGGIAFELFKATLSENRANAVLIDFKTAEGYLNYTSKNQTAADIGAASQPYENTAATISALKEGGYKIIARMYCYEDMLAASRLGAAAAVTEADGSIWLDDSAQNDGNPWLNPYAQPAETYLLQLVAEIAGSGADIILLDSVQFPDSLYNDRAVFTGEAQSIQSRNSVLHAFIEKAAEQAGDIPLCVNMTANGALNGDSTRYDGSVFDSSAAFSAVDFRKASQQDGFSFGGGIYSANSTDITALLTAALPVLQSKLAENFRTGNIIPLIDNADYVSILENMGINNYILFNTP